MTQPGLLVPYTNFALCLLGGRLMKSEKTNCHSYFAICSEGEIISGVGFVAAPNSDFSPEYITAELGIAPHETKRMGEIRKNGSGTYPFSDWSACYQDTPAIDVEVQCINIVRMLNDKIPILLKLKKEYNVSFNILIVPHIYNEQSPIIVFNKRIIEFCYETGTEIGIDLYVYDKE